MKEGANEVLTSTIMQGHQNNEVRTRKCCIGAKKLVMTAKGSHVVGKDIYDQRL